MLDAINSEYDNQPFFSNFIDDNVLKIPFALHAEKIGIHLSGGADSSILSYIILKYIRDNNLKTKVHFITYIREWRTKPWAGEGANTVYNYLKNEFSDIVVDRHLMFVPVMLEDHWDQVGSHIIKYMATEYTQYLCETHGLRYVYDSTNRPPDELLADLDDELSDRVAIIPDWKKMIEKFSIDNPHRPKSILFFLRPLTYVTKSWVMAMHKKLLDDELLDLTRSCEKTTVGYNDSGIVPTCNSLNLSHEEKCYWCQERDIAMRDRHKHL